MTTTSFMQVEAKKLDDLFFLNQDRVLLEKLRELEKMNRSKEDLAAVSRIKNEQVLEKLVKLGVCPDVLAVLSVIPFIEVAWADGIIDQKERTAIFSLLEKKGIATAGMEKELVERWLTHKPEANLLTAWIHYIEGICHEMTPDEKRNFSEEILSDANKVASAAGGFLGLGKKISKNEQSVLDTLHAAFK